MSCTAPAASSGSVDVEVSLNGQQYSSSAVPFAYHAPESVSSLSPSSGLTVGSTFVIIKAAASSSSRRFCALWLCVDERSVAYEEVVVCTSPSSSERARHAL